MTSFFHRPIEYLKGIGRKSRFDNNKKLGYFNVKELTSALSFRYEDRTIFTKFHYYLMS